MSGDRLVTETLREQVAAVIARRVSPDRTRAATWLERLTVARLSWTTLVRLNAALEIVGRAATAIWVGVIAAAVIGLRWRNALESALNAGRPVRAIVALALLLAIGVLVAVHSLLGFARWRIQRELWRREIASTASPGARTEPRALAGT